MIRISQCAHCSKFIESDTYFSAIHGFDLWSHVTTREIECEWPVYLERSHRTYATPVPEDYFAPQNGKFALWLGN